MSLALKRYYDPIRHPPDSKRLHGFAAYTLRLLRAADPGRGGLPQLRCPPSAHSTLPTAGSSWTLRFQVLHVVHGLRRDQSGSALPCPSRASFTRLQGSLYVADWPVASPKGLSTLRFDAERFPSTSAACYPAPWRLPGPDFHRLADITLRMVQSLGITSSQDCPCSGLQPHSTRFSP